MLPEPDLGWKVATDHAREGEEGLCATGGVGVGEEGEEWREDAAFHEAVLNCRVVLDACGDDFCGFPSKGRVGGGGEGEKIKEGGEAANGGEITSVINALDNFYQFI